MSVLSTREIEILQACLDFDGDLDQVGQALFIERSTVRNTLHQRIFKKLFVSSLIGAIRVGLGARLLDLEKSLTIHPPDFLKP